MDSAELATRVFRAGNAYDLVVFDRLSREEQAAFAELRGDPNVYGVLQPRSGTGRTYRAVSKDVALLLLTLREPGPLPFFVWSGDHDAIARDISTLVLDGVIEIEEAGNFVGGANAAALFARKSAMKQSSRLAELSRQAMVYAQALHLTDADRLATRMYLFGRCPVSPELTRQMRDDETALEWLGAPRGSKLRRILDHQWHATHKSESSAWFAWSRAAAREQGQLTPAYKMYISPQLADVAKALEIVVECLGRRGAAEFKIGRRAEGVARADKMVAYFDSIDSLLETGNELVNALAGIRAHGVPFSADISADGLLSWGMDPPVAARTLSWQGGESWRMWVVRRLAVAMIAAERGGESSLQPWEFAVERLRREGVDTDHWTPSATIWNAA